MLRVETSFQDSPDDVHYFFLEYNGRPLAEQLDELGLTEGDAVILWEEDCGDYTVEATLLVDYQHPLVPARGLWAKAKSMPSRSTARA